MIHFLIASDTVIFIQTFNREMLSRKKFLIQTGQIAIGSIFLNETNLKNFTSNIEKPILQEIKEEESVIEYIKRIKGSWDQTLYRQLIGFANPYKEGDDTLGVAAKDDETRQKAKQLLGNTTLKELQDYSVFDDEIKNLIESTVDQNVFSQISNWKLQELKTFILSSPEEHIKAIMPGLSSDIIACTVKLMTNDELIQVGQKVFNPLSGSKIGSKGYMSARVQPNSPTDNIDDISWQVFWY